MAKVELIDFTGKGRDDETWHAADLLIFTKATRLEMTPGLLEQIQDLSVQETEDQLAYMARTIPSSWEFVDVTFLVSGVSRACAQQMTRTRTASYAMQSQRVTDLSNVGVANPFDPKTQTAQHNEFDAGVRGALACYEELLKLGAAAQDARGILPINAESNIVCKYNLRNFVRLIQARSSLRVQGEYADIADQMKRAVLAVWPWAEPFFEPSQQAAISILEEVVGELGLETGKGAGWQIAKAIDLLRKS